MNNTNSFTEFKWCGVVEYTRALRMQAACDLTDVSAVVLGLEHPSVITMGRRADPSLDLAADANLPVQFVERGGQATLHSPGQLVIYPVADLRRLNFSVREWVDFLLDVTAATFAQNGIPTSASEGSGLWTEKGKIAFLGLRVKSGISSHGLSINLRNDLSLSSQIRSCGVSGATWDRALDHGVNLSPQEFFSQWRSLFLSRLETGLDFAKSPVMEPKNLALQAPQ